MSSVVGRFSEAPYATHSVFSILGGDARYELDRDLDRRRGAPGICDDGGGVISDEDSDGGERNFPLSECEVWLPALILICGEAERLVR
jgi:hypothetical protein